MPLGLPNARLRLPGRRLFPGAATTPGAQQRRFYIPYGRRWLAKMPNGGRHLRVLAGKVPVGRRFYSRLRTTPKDTKDYKPFYRRWTTYFPALAFVVFFASYFSAPPSDPDHSILDPDMDFEPIKVKGGPHIHLLHTLPLRGLSRLWGFVNSIPIPGPLRDPSLRLYSTIFGCDLTEIDPPNLREYPSLGEFFSRRLVSGARPVEEGWDIVSPADGLVVNLGVVQEGGRVEQVKGMSYSIDALLGVAREGRIEDARGNDKGQVLDEKEFARINGIEYSLAELMGGTEKGVTGTGRKAGDEGDASVPREGELQHDIGVASEMGLKQSLSSSSSSEDEASNPSSRPKPKRRQSSISDSLVKPGNKLHFAVIYLAPGDYHRFHSPAAWVVERRRHFVGELFSVSPYMLRHLENLFVLNERVSLLGRWKNGFFGMVPVGATNVGSIRIGFDQDLRTNTHVRRRDRKAMSPGTYLEATYAKASRFLGGQPLGRGDEMGGFLLGSTIVLVFEAPEEGWEWGVKKGEKVKVGMGVGRVKS